MFGLNPRAITYRKLHDIPAEWGTAVNVTMVFGNMGNDAPPALFHAPVHRPEHLLRRVSGECAGRRGGRHPRRLLSRLARARRDPVGSGDARGLRRTEQVREKLEQHYHDMQDLEFTVQKHKRMLQTRNGKRTAARRCALRWTYARA